MKEVETAFLTTLAVATMANLKKNGVGDEDHILNRGGDTELTDDRGSHDDPNQKSSVAIWGRSNSRSHWGRLQAGPEK